MELNVFDVVDITSELVLLFFCSSSVQKSTKATDWKNKLHRTDAQPYLPFKEPFKEPFKDPFKDPFKEPKNKKKRTSEDVQQIQAAQEAVFGSSGLRRAASFFWGVWSSVLGCRRLFLGCF